MTTRRERRLLEKFEKYKKYPERRRFRKVAVGLMRLGYTIQWEPKNAD